MLSIEQDPMQLPTVPAIIALQHLQAEIATNVRWEIDSRICRAHFYPFILCTTCLLSELNLTSVISGLPN